MVFVMGAGHMVSRQNTNEQNWRRGSQRDISNEDYSACAEKAKGSKGIDNFMRAIGEQESGDNYDAVKAKNRPQYANGIAYPSINEYADSVMSRFENVGKSSLRSEI